MAEYYRVEQLADMFLEYLFQHRKEGRSLGLSDCFSKKNVYIDGELATGVIELLVGKKMMKEVQGTLDLLSFKIEDYQQGEKIMKPAHFLDGYAVEANYPHYEITPKGCAFITHGRKLDIQSLLEAKESRKKWLDRLINFGIAVATALFIFLLTEPMKRKLAEQETNTSKRNDSESSPLRPRVDQRQRPEPGEPAGGAAPRGQTRL